MQLTTAALSLLAVGAVQAATTPSARAASKSMMADTAEWTITSMQRVCNAGDTSCAWSFGVVTGDSAIGNAECAFTVTGSPASETGTSGVACGPFTVSSGWSGQFGPGNGFTTLSVVDYAANLIVWPAYTDNQLDSGTVVTPDQSYAPQNLP